MSNGTISGFEELLEPREIELLELRARWHAIDVFSRELHQVTRGRPFEIRNDVAWNWILDARDMFVILFASWAKGMFAPGGFFPIVQAHHVRAFRPKYSKEKLDDVPAEVHAARAAAFARLFPDAVARGTVRPEDVAAVKDGFYTFVQPLLDNRHAHAHRYERGTTTAAAFIPHGDFKQYFERSAADLNALRICADLNGIGHHDHFSFASPEWIAREMVDAVVLGAAPIAELLDRRGQLGPVVGADGLARPRDRVYARLHELARQLPPEAPFNDDGFMMALADEAP
jgi:hypothetical protein